MIKNMSILKRNSLINLSSFFVYLIPFALLTGPAIPDILLSLTAIIFLILSISSREYFYFKNNFFYIFIIFYIYLVLISLFSDDAYFSLRSSLFYFRFIIFSLAIWFLISNNKYFVKIFSAVFFVTFVFALLDGYSQYIFNYNLFGYDKPENRLFLTFDDSVILGGYISRLFPLLIALIFIKNTKLKYKIPLLFVLLIFTDLLIYISGERTAFGLLILMTVLIVLLISSYRKIIIITFAISSLLIIVTTLTDKNIRYKMIDHTISQMSNMAISDEDNKSNFVIFSLEHHAYIMTAWEMFKHKPLIGHGPNSFRKNCDKNQYQYNKTSCTTHPHNTYIQILSEIGLFGLLFLVVIIFYLSAILIKKFLLQIGYNNTKQAYSDYQIYLIICFIITLWPFFPTQNFFNNWINIIYYLPVGFYLQEIYKNK